MRIEDMQSNSPRFIQPSQEEMEALATQRDPSNRFDGLFSDTVNFLQGNFVGNMAPWAYLNGGRAHLEAFFESEDYDGTKEADFIPTLGRKFARELPEKITLIELGPGHESAYRNKTGAFIKAFMDTVDGKKQIVEYHAMDIVPEYAQGAAAFVNKEFGIPTSHTVGDYYKHKKPLKTAGTPVLISWNPPIWNAPTVPNMEREFVYASSLKRIADMVGPKALGIITHFPIIDRDETERIYNSEHNRAAVMAIARLIENRLIPDCHTLTGSGQIGKPIPFSEIFDFKAAINAKGDYVSMGLVAKVNAEISIGEEYATRVEKDERLVAVGSAKPSVGGFGDIARAARIRQIDTEKNEDGSVVGQLIGFQPS